jgi:arsenate reductase (thioredoxin)
MKVLFVCLGNACRSQMAEVIAKKIGANVIEPTSAGVTPLGFVPIETIDTLLKNGYTPEALESKEIHPELCDAAEVIINMSGVPREDAFANFDKVEDWNVEDPYHRDLETYQKVLEDIETRVGALVGRLSENPVHKENN